MSESGFGVHKVRLEPGRQSTMLHSHLAESEWMYMLKGSATLVLGKPVVADESDLRPPFGGEVVEERRDVTQGDFIGFRELLSPPPSPLAPRDTWLRLGDCGPLLTPIQRPATRTRCGRTTC